MSPNQSELFQIAPPDSGESIEAAVKAAFDDLEAKELLGPIEKAKRAALVKAAQTIDQALGFGRVSVAQANVLKQILETLDSLPRPAEGTDRELDAFDQALAALTSEALA
ncbi:hypothetical protein [Schaalia sp. ZJ1691]|uniref:hypothetical protein n=1 Tax=Schaalia sp. ZJ1691 TaxID=2709404 RepID=UPI0013EB02A6|nr:hypothetical protein [Schaalia sp. ZJ1691]